jgi:acetylornithine deacetylase/succinyl-diaminopimelate desuccinylase-like protein
MSRGQGARRGPGLAGAAGAALLLWTAAGATAGDRAPAPEPAEWKAVGEEAARLLSGYIRIDTTNPPGGELPGAQYLARFFRAEGIETQIFESAPGRANVVARLPATNPDASARPILLLSHIDVVPADPEAWSFPPFEGVVREGWVYGRGAIDDKGQGIVHALAFALFQRLGTSHDRDIVFAATAAEEAGFDAGADWMVEHHWDDLGPPAVVWNEGGTSTRSPIADDRVVNAIATTEKRSLWLTLVAHGPGGHGSQPIPDSATNRLVRALDRILDHPTPLRITPTVAESLRRVSVAAEFPLGFAMRHVSNPLVLRLAGPELEANRVTNAMVRDTVALTGLEAGLEHNVIPRRAAGRLDLRLLPDTDSQAFLDWVRAVVDDPEIEIEIEPDSDAVAFRAWRKRVVGDADASVPPSPVDTPFFEALEAELAQEFPGSITIPLQTTGGSDSKYFRARGVPAYGYLPALADPQLLDSIHGLDERVPVAELERAVRLTYRTLVRLTH